MRRETLHCEILCAINHLPQLHLQPSPVYALSGKLRLCPFCPHKRPPIATVKLQFLLLSHTISLSCELLRIGRDDGAEGGDRNVRRSVHPERTARRVTLTPFTLHAALT